MIAVARDEIETLAVRIDRVGSIVMLLSNHPDVKEEVGVALRGVNDSLLSIAAALGEIAERGAAA